MGTVLKSEAVDVEAHVNLLRQRIHDSPAQRVPGLAAEHRGGERQVVEGGNTGGRSGPAEIAHCDLGDFFHRRHVAQDVEHDRSMRELEAFVSIAQVAVGVDMQDAELPVAVTQGTDQSVGRRMVAPDQSHGLPCVEPPRRLRPDVGVHGAAAFVDAAHLAYRIVVLGTSPAFEMGNHLLRIAAQALRLLQQRIVHIGRGDTAAPHAGSQRLMEVELRRGFYHGIGRMGRPGAVRHRHVPRSRNQHQFGRSRLERQPEIGPVIHTDPVGIEGV